MNNIDGTTAFALGLVLGILIGTVDGFVIGYLFLRHRLGPEADGGAAAAKPSGEALRLLALMQQEGRLVDFLLEDLEGIPDEQIGAGVRQIHRQCRKVLLDHLQLEPILDKNEGEQVTVPAGFDPSAIRLTGNVTGQPPFTGTLQHRGLRVKDIRIPKPPSSQDNMVLMPAEIELP
ncbi:MAG: DUF2760 domain-containing protein [Gemmatales bacterium]|nr:DUF2760 domain-containing protein [Gemmatales bacterium]MDW8385952.1 DUF2760 domain-containing protein [Gemmatales bacterium]